MGVSASLNRTSSPAFPTNSAVDQNGNLEFTESSYPPPKPSLRKKADIFNEVMLKDAVDFINTGISDELLMDYEELVHFLTMLCNTELEKLCNIFAFTVMCERIILKNSAKSHSRQSNKSRKSKEQIHPSSLDFVDKTSPKDYIKALVQGKGRYAFFFTYLCRKANLPCALVPGIAKSAEYDVGDSDVDHLRNVWTTVFINNEWRFVHPLWAVKTLSGKTKNEWILVDTYGDNIDKLSSTRQTIQQQNTFWFLTDAYQFINWCFPDDERWQLLEKPLSKDDFLSQLYRKESFFNMGLEITNQKSCCLNLENGYVDILLNVPEKLCQSFSITYELNRKGKSAKKEKGFYSEPYFVAMIKNFPRIKFMLKFPVIDVFILNIFGGDVKYSSTLKWLCGFKIDSMNAFEEWLPFPKSPYVGWGAGIETTAAGLKALTHKNGLIHVNDANPFKIKFELLKNVVLIADLLAESDIYQPIIARSGNDDDDDDDAIDNKNGALYGNKSRYKGKSKVINKQEIRRYSKDNKPTERPPYNEKHQNTVELIVTLPRVNRDYGLTLYTKDQTNGVVRNAINYLVRRNVDSDVNAKSEYTENKTSDSLWKDVQRKVTVQDESKATRKLKKDLSEAGRGDDMDQLQRLIDVYQIKEDKPCIELTLAQERLAHLQRRKALEQAMKYKQTGELERAIQAIKDKGEVDKVGRGLVRNAENLLARLVKLEKSRQHVTSLNHRGVSEVRRYNHAVKTVHDVIAAVYALLGENPENLKEWKYVQSLLGKDKTEGIIFLVGRCNVNDVSESSWEACLSFVGEHTFNECHDVSMELAVFYQWVKSMLNSRSSVSPEQI